MRTEQEKRKANVRAQNKKAAKEKDASPGGFTYFGDYQPRYEQSFDIYEKAKGHMSRRKKELRKKDEQEE